jgi:hypothetical protein
MTASGTLKVETRNKTLAAPRFVDNLFELSGFDVVKEKTAGHVVEILVGRNGGECGGRKQVKND